MSKISENISKYISKRRRELGLSLDQVAKRMKCSKSHVWEIEKGMSTNPTIATALSLCGALQCSLNDLLGQEFTTDIDDPDAAKETARRHQLEQVRAILEDSGMIHLQAWKFEFDNACNRMKRTLKRCETIMGGLNQ